MAEDWQKQLVRDELTRATDLGETRSEAALQEACGLGRRDLEAALADLRDDGLATNVAPGEWELLSPAMREERAAAGNGVASAADVPEPGQSLAEAERANTAGRQTAWYVGATGSPRVVMPRAMVDAMDANVLGGILKAGIEANGDGPFVFEVTP